jgi:hypothetical protein
MLETSLTQRESQLTLQQYESNAQICVTHGSQPLWSATPVTHLLCAQLPAQLMPQTLETSPTQMLSQLVLQQYESTAQICVTHGSQPLWSAAPVEHLLWAQADAQPLSTTPLQSLSSASLHTSADDCVFCVHFAAPPLQTSVPALHTPDRPVEHAAPPPGLPSST